MLKLNRRIVKNLMVRDLCYIQIGEGVNAYLISRKTGVIVGYIDLSFEDEVNK